MLDSYLLSTGLSVWLGTSTDHIVVLPPLGNSSIIDYNSMYTTRHSAHSKESSCLVQYRIRVRSPTTAFVVRCTGTDMVERHVEKWPICAHALFYMFGRDSPTDLSDTQTAPSDTWARRLIIARHRDRLVHSNTVGILDSTRLPLRPVAVHPYYTPNTLLYYGRILL